MNPYKYNDLKPINEAWYHKFITSNKPADDFVNPIFANYTDVTIDTIPVSKDLDKQFLVKQFMLTCTQISVSLITIPFEFFCYDANGNPATIPVDPNKHADYLNALNKFLIKYFITLLTHKFTSPNQLLDYLNLPKTKGLFLENPEQPPSNIIKIVPINTTGTVINIFQLNNKNVVDLFNTLTHVQRCYAAFENNTTRLIDRPKTLESLSYYTQFEALLSSNDNEKSIKICETITKESYKNLLILDTLNIKYDFHVVDATLSFDMSTSLFLDAVRIFLSQFAISSEYINVRTNDVTEYIFLSSAANSKYAQELIKHKDKILALTADRDKTRERNNELEKIISGNPDLEAMQSWKNIIFRFKTGSSTIILVILGFLIGKIPIFNLSTENIKSIGDSLETIKNNAGENLLSTLGTSVYGGIIATIITSLIVYINQLLNYKKQIEELEKKKNELEKAKQKEQIELIEKMEREIAEVKLSAMRELEKTYKAEDKLRNEFKKKEYDIKKNKKIDVRKEIERDLKNKDKFTRSNTSAKLFGD